MISALLDGGALTASELALAARITPQTASTHLAKLTEAGLLSVVPRGLHRQFLLGPPPAGDLHDGILAVALAKRTGAKLVSSADLARALQRQGYPEKQASYETVGNIGGVIQTGDATVTMVPAVHSSDLNGPDAHLGGGNPVGFLIRVKGGPTVYHTGDTDVTLDMRQIPERYGPVDYMLACIGGHFTMDPAGAALAASYVQARTVVPMHFGTFPVIPGTPQELEAALKGRSKVQVLEAGKATPLQ